MTRPGRVRLLTISLAMSVALFALPRAHADDPNSRKSKTQAAEVNTQLALAYMRENNLSAARDKIDKALQQNPNTAKTQMAAGFVYDRLGDKKKASSHYEQAARLGKDDPDVLQNVGVHLCRTGSYKRGEEYLLQAATSPLYQTPAVAYTNAGRCARDDKRPKDAETHFRKALAVNPKQADALLQMAELTHEAGSSLQARAFLERYVSVAAASASSLWLGRSIELGLGDTEQAARYAQRLKDEFPNSVETGLLYDAEQAREQMTAPDAGTSELPSSPGARLRREREARGLTEQQAAEMLTLDPSVVMVLEANDFAALGAPVFAKGHLRRYAALLGVPEDEILGAYERSKQHMAEPSLVPKSRLEMLPERGRAKWPWVLGGAIAFLAAAMLAAYISENGLPWVGGSPDDGQTAAGSATTESTPPPSASAGMTGEPAAAGADVPATVGDTTTASPPAPGDATTASGTAGSPASTPAAGAASAPAAAAVLGAGQVRLQLRFKGDSWVEVFDGSGRAVLYDLGKGGTERTLTATAPLSVTIGNAAVVNVAVNGRAVAAPRQQGQVMARFSVAPDGSVR